MRRTSRRQTWSPEGATAIRKRRRRRTHKNVERQRLRFSLLVVTFVVAWLWFVMTVVSWISQDKSPVNTHNNGGAEHSSLRGNGQQENQSTDNDKILDENEEDHQQQVLPQANDTAALSRDTFHVPTSFQRYSEHAPSCDIALSPDDVDFTLVTQLSQDRLWMMKYHCQRWGSLISVAILTNRTHESIEHELSELGCNTTELSLQTLSSSFYPADEYPVNVLRNMALKKVKTSHVMYADIDFWESNDLRELLHLPNVRTHLASSHKHALVVPAFQLNRVCKEWRECPEDNIPRMPSTRNELLSLLKKKHAYPFDPTNRGGHGSTLYSSWVTKQKEPGSMLTIPCVYSNRYEPYLAFRYCRDLPPFQEDFSGYGKNKMTMMIHMLRSGYRLDQLGTGFLVHYPHLDSKSRMEWNESPEAVQPKKINGKWHKDKPETVKNVDWLSYKRGRVDAVFVAFRKWLVREVPDEAVIHKCASNEDDDAKLWYDRNAQ